MFAIGLKKEKPNSSTGEGRSQKIRRGGKMQIGIKFTKSIARVSKILEVPCPESILSHRPLKRAHMYLHF